jgi:putative methyltransferase (TIGR04325 family)
VRAIFSTFKFVAQNVLPSGITNVIRDSFFRNRWTGDYLHWEDAEKASRSYSEEAILRRMILSARRVRDGEYAFEQDGKLFKSPAANPHILAGIFRARASLKNFSVIDFGGAFGSAYWRHRQYIHDIGTLRWAVVEQANFVEVGKREFNNEELSFHSSIRDAIAGRPPDYALVSAVLGYLKEPFGILDQLCAAGVPYIHIDRTTFSLDGRTRITVQRVPRNLGGFSYPCRMFDERDILRKLAPLYTPIWEYTTEELQGGQFKMGGVLLKRVGS